jgi:hypothetical protein
MKGWIGGVLEVSRKDYLPPIFSSNINNLEAWYVFGPASHRPMSRKQLHKLFKCPHCEASYEVTYASARSRQRQCHLQNLQKGNGSVALDDLPELYAPKEISFRFLAVAIQAYNILAQVRSRSL